MPVAGALDCNLDRNLLLGEESSGRMAQDYEESPDPGADLGILPLYDFLVLPKGVL